MKPPAVPAPAGPDGRAARSYFTETLALPASWNACELFRWADPARTTLKIFPLGDHNTIFFVNAAEYFQTLGDFFRRLARA